MDEEKKENKDEKLSFKTADELTTYLMDLQGQITNMQETIDKLSPKEEQQQEQQEEQQEELSDEEISEIDKLLQSE